MFKPNRQLRLALVTAAATSALGLGLAQAQGSAPALPAPAGASAAPQLSLRDIHDRLEAAGYRDIREIELDRGRYEVKARNPQGERVKLDVNARTGAVERLRQRD